MAAAAKRRPAATTNREKSTERPEKPKRRAKITSPASELLGGVRREREKKKTISQLIVYLPAYVARARHRTFAWRTESWIVMLSPLAQTHWQMSFSNPIVFASVHINQTLKAMNGDCETNTIKLHHRTLHTKSRAPSIR